MRWKRAALIAALALALVGTGIAARAQEGTPPASPEAATGTYISPSYGFFFSWDASWTKTGESSADGADTLTLDNGTSKATLTAYPSGGAVAQTCLDAAMTTLSADPANSNVAVTQSVPGQSAPGGDPTSAVAVFSFTNTAAAGPTEMTLLVHCRDVVPGQATLQLAIATTAAAFNDQVREQLYLLDAVVPVAPPGDQVWAQRPSHIERGAAHDPYTSNPPTSGPHIGAEIAPWGVSATPVDAEVQIHNLEHGGVMLQYNCDCPEAIAILNSLADPATGYPVKVIAAPYPGMETEIALTSWHYIWTMPAADLTVEKARAFIDAHIDRAYEHIPSESEQLAAWRATATPTP